MATTPAPPLPAPDDLLPEVDRLEVLREIMPPDELRNLYLIFADRARAASALLTRNPGELGRDEVELCVHDIKGTAANLGLDRLSRAAGVVFDTLRREGPAQALRTSQELVSLLERLPAVMAGADLVRLLHPHRS
jgi:HPt (histidine-containing phosphotransfer) domain-containing protein